MAKATSFCGVPMRQLSTAEDAPTTVAQHHFTVYVIGERCRESTLAETKALVAHRNAHSGSGGKRRFAYETTATLATRVLEPLAREPAPQRLRFEFVMLSDRSMVSSGNGCAAQQDFSTVFPPEMRRRCKAAGVLRYGNVDGEARLYHRALDGVDVCERLRPRKRADMVPGTERIYDLAADHYSLCNAPVCSPVFDGNDDATQPLQVLLLVGERGIGKSAALDAIGAPLGESYLRIDTDDIDVDDVAGDAAGAGFKDCVALYDFAERRAQELQRTSRRCTLLLFDNADLLTGGKRFVALLNTFAQLPPAQRPAIVLLLNDWYARTDVVHTLRTREKEYRGTSAYQLVRHQCNAPTIGDLEQHLQRHFTQCAPDVRRAIAAEARGDVRAAMRRIDFIMRSDVPAEPNNVRTVARRDTLATVSPAEQLRVCINDSRTLAQMPRRARPVPGAAASKQPLEDNHYALTERQFSTVAETDLAELLLASNVPRLLSGGGGGIMKRAQSDCDVMARVLDCLSLSDMMRTQQRMTCYKGADERLNCAIGVAGPCGIIGRATVLQQRPRFLEMDFGAATNDTRAGKHAVRISELANLSRAAAVALDGGERLLATERDTDQPLGTLGRGMPDADARDRFDALGQHWDDATLALAARRAVFMGINEEEFCYAVTAYDAMRERYGTGCGDESNGHVPHCTVASATKVYRAEKVALLNETRKKAKARGSGGNGDGCYVPLARFTSNGFGVAVDADGAAVAAAAATSERTEPKAKRIKRR